MLTKKKRNIAKIAEANTKSQSNDKAIPEKPTEKVTVKPVLFDLSGFDEKKIEQAEALGIPVRAIAKRMNDFAEQTNIKFQVLANAIPNKEQVKGAMAEAIAEAQNRQREEYAKAVKDGKASQGGGMGVGQILQLLSSGGGGDSEMASLTKEMMKVNIESIRADIGFSKAIKSALVAKITGKAVSDVLG